RLERDEEVRDRATNGEGDQDLERRAPADRGEQCERESAADDQVGELDRAQRQVGPFELALQVPPDAAMAEGVFGRAEQTCERREALALLTLAGFARAFDVRREPRLDPRALGRREQEAAGGEHEE